MDSETRDRQVRVGRNQSLFREVNERIEGLKRDSSPETEIDFICECFIDTCFEPLSVTVAEYERVRARPDTFLVRPEHVDLSAEDVAERKNGYWIVAKTGDARNVAVATSKRLNDA